MATKAEQGRKLKSAGSRAKLPQSMKNSINNAFKQFEADMKKGVAPKTTTPAKKVNMGQTKAQFNKTRNAILELDMSDEVDRKRARQQGKNLMNIGKKTGNKGIQAVATRFLSSPFMRAAGPVGTGLTIAAGVREGRRRGEEAARKAAKEKGQKVAKKVITRLANTSAAKTKAATNLSKAKAAKAKKAAQSKPKGGISKVSFVRTIEAPKAKPAAKKSLSQRVNQENKRRANTAAAKVKAASSFSKAKAAKAKKAAASKPKASRKVVKRGPSKVTVRKNVSVPSKAKRRGARR
jgi:hypothetical protein